MKKLDLSALTGRKVTPPRLDLSSVHRQDFDETALPRAFDSGGHEYGDGDSNGDGDGTAKDRYLHRAVGNLNAYGHLTLHNDANVSLPKSPGHGSHDNEDGSHSNKIQFSPDVHMGEALESQGVSAVDEESDDDVEVQLLIPMTVRVGRGRGNSHNDIVSKACAERFHVDDKDVKLFEMKSITEREDGTQQQKIACTIDSAGEWTGWGWRWRWRWRWR